MSRIFDTKIASGERLLASDMLDLTFFPVGMIMLMDGSWLDGRGGWYICDGQKKNIPGRGEVTMPDLRDRFIRGNTTSGNTGGGSVTLTQDNLPSHNHTLGELTISGNEHSHSVGTLAVTITGGTHGHTVTDPGHTHTVSNVNTSPSNNSGGGATQTSKIPGIATTSKNTSGISIASTTGLHEHTAVVSGSIGSIEHSHQISGGNIGNTGSGTAFNVVPAYYTVIYIKKMV
ncbi:MAG: hypothetical protein LBL50_02295 [Candidatus Margulisbacteria bacterium]|jgi:hypothetical protein|nr:hypothetical protein [Candidatus Margulisiibacteriota bacterium]